MSGPRVIAAGPLFWENEGQRVQPNSHPLFLLTRR